MQIAGNTTIINSVLQAYGYSSKKIHPPQAGYRNQSYAADLADGQTANLMLYKSEQGILSKIRNANHVGDYLANTGFPARQTLDPRILRLTRSARPKYAAVYHYLPGHTIAWEAYTMNHLKLMGQAMGVMHEQLRQTNAPRVFADATVVHNTIIRHMQHYFSQPATQEAVRTKLQMSINHTVFQRSQHLIDYLGQLPGKQPLHLDFVRSNLLFDETPHHNSFTLGSVSLTGIIDFEKTATGHPIFDLARSIAFLLVDVTSKSEAKIMKYFLHSGYHKRGGGALPNPALLKPLVAFFLFYDFYKFLRHNPYEYLEQNAHFKRTRDLLITRKLLSRP